MNDVYSVYHYYMKTKKNKEAIDEIAPKVIEAADKAVLGNIGDIRYTTRTTVPNGGEWCDGLTYTKTRYPEVYNMLLSGNLQCVDMETYDNVVALNGSCGFFGLDVKGESFKVPLLDDVYIKAGQKASEFGAESLPNITGSLETLTPPVYGSITGTGSFVSTKNGSSSLDSYGTTNNYKVDFDASLSSEAYQEDAKVNPDHVKYRAYVILYTAFDVKADITKEYQLNNPFFFGISQWFDCDPNNASWLLSNGSYHSGATYKSFYEWLVSEYNNPNRLPRRVNADVVGNPVISDGVVSGFSASNYLVLDNKCKSTDNAEYVFKFTTGSDVNTSQKIIHTQPLLAVELYNGKLTSYNVSKDSNTLILDASPNTTYWVKVVINGTSRTTSYSYDGVNFIGETIDSDAGIGVSDQYKFILGLSSYNLSGAFNGSIDLSQSYIKINGKIWWRGFTNSVKADGELHDDYDYILNLSDRTFRLPKKSRTASGNAVVGNGITLGLTDGTNNAALTQATYLQTTTGSYGEPVGGTKGAGVIADGKILGVTTDPLKSGIETSSKGLKLYFYVGEVVQDANLIEIGRIMEQLAKIDYVVESKVATESDPTWYRVYKSGWIEQGGETNIGIITYPKAFNDTNYNLQVTPHVNQSAQVYWNDFGYDLTTTGFKLRLDNYKTQWRACGQGA